MSQIAVVGDGGWGTSLAIILEGRQHQVSLWSVSPEYVRVLEEKKENIKFLPGVTLPSAIRITSDLQEAVKGAEFVILAVPSRHMRTVMEKMKGIPLKKAVVVSVAKGLEQQSLLRMSELILQIIRPEKLAVLSGPTIAYEVAAGMPGAAVVASPSKEIAEQTQKNLSTQRFRLYASNDVIGVELGGALKNVIAIAAGLSDGLGFGSNAKAALLARGLEEITRLGVLAGAKRETFSGLSGLGDLITTCLSQRSRNRGFGEAVAKGKPVQDVLRSTEMVVEGVDTVQSARELARKLGAEVPITEEVYRVIFENKNPQESIDFLMNRPMRAEF
ncbi:MAG: NAD(P)-dependent glycerol-3-phosphate dehydrogenase [Candidatus Omnitrophica bacterium]|nr:NAD(P)-dependent glycerol-3-phosphate dehydrogenase [Candidatus Omnitrophota bacterium]